MGEAMRVRDVIDTAPRFTTEDVARLNAEFAGVSTQEMLARVLGGKLLGRIAVVSSFGTESAVLLHLVAHVDAATPVLFIDTGKHFPQTLAYGGELVERLGLTGVSILTPDPETIAARDETGLRWSYDPDGCCALRKVAPLDKALVDFDATISGRKGFQAGTRAGLKRFELDGDRIKLNPLADWSRDDIAAYFETHDLPRHPLEAEGYPSIGCAPCTSKVLPGEDPRAGRWRGWDKVECGLHSPVADPDDPANQPVF